MHHLPPVRVRGSSLAVAVVTLGVAGLVACSSAGGGGSVVLNPAVEPTTTTTEPAGTPVMRLASFNVLHGVRCLDGNHCDFTNRAQLFADEIEREGCPDVIALQEIAPWWVEALQSRTPTLCKGAYTLVFPRIADPYTDKEAVLTVFPATNAERIPLAGRPATRTALYVRLTTGLGPVDLVVTHTGTGSDHLGNGGPTCAESADCPPQCPPELPSIACQLIQLRDVANAHDDGTALVSVIAGDLNLVHGSPLLNTFFDAGYVDTYLAAQRPECEPGSGGCTAGRDDTNVDVLRDPAPRLTERIDYVLLRPTERCNPAYGPKTGLFAATAATNGPGGLAWVSDHVGSQVELGCG